MMLLKSIALIGEPYAKRGDLSRDVITTFRLAYFNAPKAVVTAMVCCPHMPRGLGLSSFLV